MSETGNKKMRGNVERVLRAMDVIPPFDDEGIADEPGVARSDSARPRIQPWKRPEGRATVTSEAHDASPTDELARHIPTLDLGEKILAEQRRMTAPQRKGPGSTAQVERREVQQSPVVAMRAERAVEPPAQDVAQLQQLVAEIVARDIDRLCAGPARMSV